MQDREDLVFKGLRRFRYRRDEALLEDALRSPYYWWWAYLRLSKDYWWAAHSGQALPEDVRLRGMWWDFGHVYSTTFEQWWSRRGIDLFMQRVELPRVRQLNHRDLQLSRDITNRLLLEIPLNLTERTIISQIRKILRAHPDRSIERISHGQRNLAKLVGIRQDVIESAHAVWRVHYESRDRRKVTGIGQTQGSKSLYQIGKELRLVRTCMPVVTDDKERAAKRVNGMKVAVSRMLSRANHLIANAAIGEFPSIQAPKEPIRWRPRQQRRLDEAVAAGHWRPLFDPNDTLIVP